MTALTANVTRLIRGAKSTATEIADTVEVFAGSFLGLRGPNHATTQGDFAPYANENGMIFVGGHSDNNDTGDATPAAGTNEPEARVNLEPKIYPRQTVTGLASRADIGALCYLTDDNLFTLTRPAKGGVVGCIVEYFSGAIGDVFVLGFATQLGVYLSGGGKQTIALGTVVAELGAAADLLTGWIAPFHGKITAVYAICGSAPVDADMNMACNLEIGAADVTGGVVTLNFADATGANKAGTAITAANVFHEGDLVDFEAAAAGFVAGTAGDGVYTVYIVVEPLLGA